MIKYPLATVFVVLLTLLPLFSWAASIPVFWDTAWILPLAQPQTIDDYFQARARQGIVEAIIMGIGSWGLDNVALGNGQKLFLAERGGSTPDITQPNELGFQYIDNIVQKALGNNLTVSLLPMSNGGSPSYIAVLKDAYAGENRAYNYGRYLGNRYKDHPNIIWVLGGDVSVSGYPQIRELTRLLAQGLRDTGANQLITFHVGWNENGEGSSVDAFPPDGQWLDFNMVQHRKIYEQMIRIGYAAGKPIGLGEGPPDGAFGKYPMEIIRAEPFQVFLAGASYYTYAHQDIVLGTSYTASLNTPGFNYAARAKKLMQNRGWQSYTPDQSFVTDYSGSKTAAIKGNSAAMVYLANDATSVTITMGRLNALGNVRVQRFNTADGTSVLVGDFPATGTQTFDTGGLSDAVILLDAVSGSEAADVCCNLLIPPRGFRSPQSTHFSQRTGDSPQVAAFLTHSARSRNRDSTSR